MPSMRRSPGARGLRRLSGFHTACIAGLLSGPLAGFATAQAYPPGTGGVLPEVSRVIIIPQARVYPPASQGVAVTGVEASVSIIEQVASTTLDIQLYNPSGARREAELIVPVPENAVVRGFTFQGAGSEPTARLLPRDEARRTYEAIVGRLRDPAILEFLGYNLIRTSVFPVEPRGAQRIRLTYEHLLAADGNRFDYMLPRTESVEYGIPWKISVRIKSPKPISTIYSPSHHIESMRLGDGDWSVRTTAASTTEPGSFRLSYLMDQQGITASLLAYPDPKIGGGYFLVLAGLPAKPVAPPGTPPIRREVILALDRSGSMNGEKIEQVRNAALQVIAGLEMGESFNIIVYNEAVELFSQEPVIKTEESANRARAYLKSLNARGGTNIHDALVEALRQKPADGSLPLVLFLTDGLPTMGQTSESAIRDVALKGNPYNRRVFTFGVGVDVNTPLLEKIAYETRAATTFVFPKEDVEVKVAQVFKRLSGPVLADPKLAAAAAPGTSAFTLVRDLIPSKIPDLFDGDQLVLLGQYVGGSPITFKLSGNYLGSQQTFEFTFGFDKATTQNAFVGRLWASRKIAILVDGIRQVGADRPLTPGFPTPQPDARLKELIDEIVRLSTEFGILTEYTSFLALEGMDLTRRDLVLEEACKNFRDRAVVCRTGIASVNQELNNQSQKAQSKLNLDNRYYDQYMNSVAITTVQQVCDRAFYHKNGRWVDSRIVDKVVQPQKIVEFNSPEYHRIADELMKQNRQGCLSLRGDVLMVIGNETALIKGPAGN